MILLTDVSFNRPARPINEQMNVLVKLDVGRELHLSGLLVALTLRLSAKARKRKNADFHPTWIANYFGATARADPSSVETLKIIPEPLAPVSSLQLDFGC
jgi:hypothetical protein